MDKVSIEQDWKPRDPRGQLLGVLSVVYVVVGILFAVWILNSGSTLVTKAKLQLCCKQIANTAMVAVYLNEKNGYGLAPQSVVAAVTPAAAPILTNACGLSAPLTSYVAMIANGGSGLVGWCSSQISATPSLFGGWTAPGGAQLTQTNTSNLPNNISF